MPGDPVAAWRALERAGRRWARPRTIAFRSVSAQARQVSKNWRRSSLFLILGARPDPTRLALRPDPTRRRASTVGEGPPSPESLRVGPCTAKPSARPRPMPGLTLRPAPRALANRSSPRAPAPLHSSESVLRLAPVRSGSLRPGAALTPPQAISPGLGRAPFFATRLLHALPTGGPSDSSRVRRPSVHTPLGRAVSPGSALFCPYTVPPGEQASDRSVAQRSCVRSA